MTKYNFNAQSPQNFEQKCCCALVLDVSKSMLGEPINELNDGLEAFYKDIQADSTTADKLEISVITFNSEVKTEIEPSLVENFTMPKLTASGGTAMVDGVHEGINIVKERKEWYNLTGQTYYRPWVILITDGDPDEMQNVSSLANEIKNGMANKEFYFFAIGVKDANMEKLKSISDQSMPPAKLNGLKFSEFFRWLSASMTSVTKSGNSTKITLPSPADWIAGSII